MAAPAPLATPTRAPFPQDPSAFDADDRISFSKLSGKFLLEAEDGAEFEYDDGLRRWVAVLDESLLEQQQKAYKVEGVEEEEVVVPANVKRKREREREREMEYTNGDEEGGRLKKSHTEKEPRERKNTAVYVTNLPLDATADDVQHVFSRCGVIAEEIDSGRPRVKLYSDAHDHFKGDALIVFFRAESVNLAVQMLDDTDFRLGEASPAGKMTVVAADFSYKKQGGQGEGSERKVASGKDKKKIIKRTQKLNNKLADWDDDDPSTMQETTSRWDKVVILKHMFTLEELEEDPAAMLDIKEDIREECAKLGDVTNVVLYDKELEGVSSVRYSNPEAARACVKVMNGRHFAGTRIVAYVATGDERFSKSSDKKAALTDLEEAQQASMDVEAEEGARLDKFGSWLEEGAQRGDEGRRGRGVEQERERD